MRRTIFEPEHDDFRQTARTFFEKECAPHADEWEAQGYVDREVWLKAGALGLIGWEMPEEYGGADLEDFRFNAILNEEYWATGTVGIGLGRAERHPRRLLPQPHHRGAEAAMAPEVRVRGVHHRHRHVRAGRRLRPCEPEDHRPEGRRPLRHQRLQDLHQQRPARRPRGRRSAAPTRAPRRPTRGSA